MMETANAQADLNLCWARMPEGTFSAVEAQITESIKHFHYNIGIYLFVLRFYGTST